MTEAEPLGASYRDPSGQVFRRDGVILRAVAESYRDEYRTLMSSGLYEALTSRGLMVAHEEIADDPLAPVGTALVIRPTAIPYISYPYEWCFSQLKDAALLTLKIASLALDHGMVLKDASSYNVQFVGSRPAFIDTLSFERYVPGTPWVAYRQFCEHFLAPLALTSMVDVRTLMLMRTDLDGIPLDLASTMLPGSSRMRPSLLMHIHAHAKAQGRYADEGARAREVRVSEKSVRGLIESLAGAVRGLKWKPGRTEWGDYYEDTNYTDAAMQAKLEAVTRFVERVAPRTVWDLGANTGRFSRLTAEAGAYTLAFDTDPAAVERAYLDAKARKEARVLPLRMDLMNPSPSVGWRLVERSSFLDRGRPDLVLALALVHHIAISRNVPLEQLAGFFAGLAPRLIIEFVPKSDSQVRRLLASREDIFPCYHREGFEQAFSGHFDINGVTELDECERTLYLMEAKDVAE